MLCMQVDHTWSINDVREALVSNAWTVLLRNFSFHLFMERERERERPVSWCSTG